jgi:hypothetical protein
MSLPSQSTWYNELGSTMTLNASGAQLWGTYNSNVGQAQYDYELVGLVNTGQPLPGSGIALGWTVAWVNPYMTSPSVTSWTGQYQVDPVNGPEITTLWLLVTETTEGNDWASTQVGADLFTQNQPTDEQIQAARRRGVSHPVG